MWTITDKQIKNIETASGKSAVLPCEQIEVVSITYSGNIDNAFVPVVILDKSHKQDGFAYLESTASISLSPWVTINTPLPKETVRLDGKKDHITLKFNVKKGNPKANDSDGGDITVETAGVTVEPTKFTKIKYDSKFELKILLESIKKGAVIRFIANDDDFWGTDGDIKDVFCGGICIEGVKAPEGYYYMIDGTLVGRIGKDNDPTDVYLIRNTTKKEDVQKIIAEINAGQGKEHELVKISSSVGIKNEELNTRAFFTLIRQAENGNKPNREPLAYNVNYGGETFSSYSEHPNKSVTKWKRTSTAAGAYQILYDSWKNTINKIEKQPDFSPKSQERGAVILINEQVKWNTHKKNLISDIESGNVENMCTQLNSTWTSLPGGSQEHMNMDDAKNIFKENISKELKGETVIETLKGKLTLKL